MRKLLVSLTLVMLVTGVAGSAHARDVLNEATKKAADTVAQKIAAEAKEKETVERVAVARFQNDPGNSADLLKAAVSKTEFDVILREDDEWAKLLAEYERQVRHGDIMPPETVHKLEELGVDALIWGDVELAKVSPFQDEHKKGDRAEFRAIAKLSNLKGHLLWSDQVEEVVEEAKLLTPDELASSWVQGKKIILYGAVGILILLLVFTVFKRATTPR